MTLTDDYDSLPDAQTELDDYSSLPNVSDYSALPDFKQTSQLPSASQWPNQKELRRSEDGLPALSAIANTTTPRKTPQEQLEQEAQAGRTAANLAYTGEMIARSFDIFGALNRLGQVSRGFATDVAEGRVLPTHERVIPQFKSTGEAVRGEPISDKPEGLLKEVFVETAQALPVIATGAAAQAAKVPAMLAYSVPMAGTTYEETRDPLETAKAGVLGAIMPGVSSAGATSGKSLATKLLPKVGVSKEASTVIGNVVGSQSLLSALVVGANAPELIELAKTNPEEARREIIKIVAGNIAFEIPQLAGHLREAKAAELVDKYFQDKSYQASVDEVVQAANKMRLAPKTTEALLEQSSEVPEAKLAEKPKEEVAPIEIAPEPPKTLPEPTVRQIQPLEQDIARYNEIQKQLTELDVESPTFEGDYARLMTENEAIKNRYGGMPPTSKEVPQGELGGQAQHAEKVDKPELIGMGGAIPSEFAPPRQFITSTKNEVVDKERRQRGLPPMMTAARETNKEAWDSAMRRIDEKPESQDVLIAELSERPRPVSPTENSMLLHRRIDIRNEYEKALRDWKEAFDSGDMQRAAEESVHVKRRSAQLADLEAVTKRIGTESGRSLQARKMMADEEFSLATMEMEASEAKGRPLTDAERNELVVAHNRIKELEQFLENELRGQMEEEMTMMEQEAMVDVAKQAKRTLPRIEKESTKEDIVSRIRNKIEKNEQSELTPLVQQLARQLWREGVRERDPMIDALHKELQAVLPKFTREDTQRAFSGYGDFKPLSKAEIDVGLRDLRGQTQQVLKLEALEARKPLEKTGVERRIPSDEERRLIKQVNELKRKYGVVVTDPATQLQSALQARKTYYTNRLSDLRHEIETRERIVKTKTEPPSDEALQALKAEYEEVRAEHEMIFGRKELSDEQRLNMAIAAAERNQAQWSERLDRAKRGIPEPARPDRKVTSPELEAIRTRTEAIKAEAQELRDLADPKKSPEERTLQALKTRMANRVAELHAKIAASDFAKKERKPIEMDEEARQIKAHLDTAKEAYKQGLELDRWKRSTIFQKGTRILGDLYDSARAIMTTGELSFVLRQGKFAAASHPILSARALPSMFKALLGSPEKARAIDLAVHEHPDAPAARAAKLHLTDETSPLSKQEEILMGRLVGRIPIVRNFNQAAQIYLNKIRFDVWRAMRRSMSRSGTPTPENDALIAKFVNEATGRGGLGKAGEPAGVLLSRMFFSPRYLASRLQMATGHSLWSGTWQGSSASRKAIAMEYARILVGMSLYYSLLGLYFGGEDKKGSIETDPRSSDFGKVLIGSSRLDPQVGLAQLITFGARTATGETKTLDGKIQSLRAKEDKKVPYGKRDWYRVAADFVRSKLHPAPAALINQLTGTAMDGSDATYSAEATRLFTPITYGDIFEAFKEQDLDDATAMAILAFFGEGLSTYQKRYKKKP